MGFKLTGGVHALVLLQCSYILACGSQFQNDSLIGAIQAKESVQITAPPVERSAKAYEHFDSDFSDVLNGELNVSGVPEQSRYLSYKNEYESLWNSIAIRPEKVSTVDYYVDMIQKNKTRYLNIQNSLGVPWFWVGIIHGLEGSFNFATHLHNGDSLSRRTVQVPNGRPTNSAPPFSWEFSAKDAINYDGYSTWSDWQLASILAYSFERFNGFGYRGWDINSPYLWSYSYHYTRGKYVADGRYDPYFVSGQAGAMVILKRGIDRGLWSLQDSDIADLIKATDQPELTNLLQENNDGKLVTLLKMRLKSLGHYNGDFDENFNETTTLAVKAFQTSRGITADGVVGPYTWKNLWPSLSEATSLISSKIDSEIELRAIKNDDCLFKTSTHESPALTKFMSASVGATTLSHEGERGNESKQFNCPDWRESYDLADNKIIAAPKSTPPVKGNNTRVSWHRLFKGEQKAWHLSSYANSEFVTFLLSSSKSEVLNYLFKHYGAHNVTSALDTEKPQGQFSN